MSGPAARQIVCGSIMPPEIPIPTIPGHDATIKSIVLDHLAVVMLPAAPALMAQASRADVGDKTPGFKPKYPPEAPSHAWDYTLSSRSKKRTGKYYLTVQNGAGYGYRARLNLAWKASASLFGQPRKIGTPAWTCTRNPPVIGWVLCIELRGHNDPSRWRAYRHLRFADSNVS